jgi:hypothetical protein
MEKRETMNATSSQKFLELLAARDFERPAPWRATPALASSFHTV